MRATWSEYSKTIAGVQIRRDAFGLLPASGGPEQREIPRHPAGEWRTPPRGGAELLQETGDGLEQTEGN